MSITRQSKDLLKGREIPATIREQESQTGRGVPGDIWGVAPYTRGRVDFPRPLHKYLAEIRKAAKYNLLYLQELHQCNRGRATRQADPGERHADPIRGTDAAPTSKGARPAMCNKLLQVDKRGADQTRSRKNWNRCGRDPGTAEQSRPRSGRQGITCYTCILWHYASTAL